MGGCFGSLWTGSKKDGSRRSKDGETSTNREVSHGSRQSRGESPAISTTVSSSSGLFLSRVFAPREFAYKEISEATQNFSKDRIIGHGGSSTVYRGDLQIDTIGDGDSAMAMSVAVKAITVGEIQRATKEYVSEIRIISNIRHRHLVKLYGWSHDGGFFLLYEYFRHGSLDRFLHGPGNLYREIPWPRRLEIIKGIGSALRYLHNECDQPIIHRDVKSSNVLLDDKFTAKLGDFGLSRQMDHGESAVQTATMAGTEGYVAPEVFLTGKPTRESDMFSYGALVAEITYGRRPRDDELSLRHRYRFSQLVGWIKDLYEDGRILHAVDPRLYETGFDEDQVRLVLLLAISCTKENPKSRFTAKHAMDFLGKTI